MPGKTRPNGSAPSLYERLLGDDYKRLPKAIQAMHRVTGGHAAEGRVTVRRGCGPAAKRLASLMRLPPAMEAAPAITSFSLEGGAERLCRRYGGRQLVTYQQEGWGKDAGLLLERFGPLSLLLKLHASEAGLDFELVDCRFGSLSLPRASWPCLEASEREQEGKYRFQVSVGLPLLGLLVSYGGWLGAPEAIPDDI